ncbi:MAG: hypothetical protein G01um101418_659 [Parcubacteria group bacterium Gr01-1014_18]|nr:MAG: hypothetical protein Greene041636_630 [Parcubacteria group bacterium Greene0416_36]TSC80740.1 MAG: hypothetical protein G01um101418_659 [Parcubacteria group bacterium Gr01-1014_18]TSC98649.1 MAG: hypothetical protein Greene101420_608 [Parcubacteria group bacterium Greene1014_20]TSD07191.1 MAG: hypothetical protein Greene07142_360 [Parcubacteria group bacterium Greene0714_2]
MALSQEQKKEIVSYYYSQIQKQSRYVENLLDLLDAMIADPDKNLSVDQRANFVRTEEELRLDFTKQINDLNGKIGSLFLGETDAKI